ncbi:MAG: effector binding domain-containing protein [Candidatus Thorarchaeota archaeon]
MNKKDIRIVKLAPMRVASVVVISETPELEAWAKLRAWAEMKGLLGDLEQHPVFGFNEPPPQPGKREYGYMFWIRVGDDIESDNVVEVKEVEGSEYAVTTCVLKEELGSDFFKEHGVLESWWRLEEWAKKNGYKYRGHPGLEKPHDPDAGADLVLDLYYPITK